MRLIDADAFWLGQARVLASELRAKGPFIYSRDNIDNIIKCCPTVDPVQHAYWVEVEDDEQGVAYHCSCCDEWVFYNKGFRFCPHCGAKMEVNTND